ncbi:hypothetical protein [Thiocystis violascens]|uniref:Uncharacterized protein n=1 Tax=Thiocystis violascens (strain ATCC 17096 / DSM 198 / 6111) TaxID=765911 RepID=I3Y595_THIV6|nr:hypothetical protein [Thiocystis violascens]AFL72163.1 hypothetical protein Thivi_0075 [Thiocystis violascens DSM 198]
MSEPVPAILIIEDEPKIRRFMRLALEREGCLRGPSATGPSCRFMKRIDIFNRRTIDHFDGRRMAK